MDQFQFSFIEQFLFYLHKDCFHASPDVICYIGCQFALESNFGKSDLAKRCNNFSGMRAPRSRIGFYKVDDYGNAITHDGFIGGFATYVSAHLCFFDYVVWLTWCRFTQDEMMDLEKFKAHLVRTNYCPEIDYFKKVDNIFKNFKNFQNVDKNAKS